jgi:O-antigen/teichoic acid export membrane protein
LRKTAIFYIILVYAHFAQVHDGKFDPSACSEFGTGCPSYRRTRSVCMSILNRHSLRLPASIKQGLTLLSGTTLAQAIPAIASPLITRLFRPGDVGAFAFVVAVFGVLTPVACLRYDLAIMLPEDDVEASRLTALCLTIGAATAMLLLLALLIIWDLVSGVETRTIASLLAIMLPMGILLLSLQLVAQNWSLRTHNYPIQSRAVITQALVTIGGQILFGAALGSSAYTLVIGMLAGYVALVLVYLPVIREHVVPRLQRHYSRAGMLAVARTYLRFPLYTGPYAFFGQVSARSAILVLAALTSANIVGQYGVAQRVIYLPVATLLAAASQIFYSRAARGLDDPRMPHMVRTALVAGPLIVGPFFLLVVLFAEPIFRIVFGAEWQQAGRFAAILALPSMVKTLTVWLDRVFDIRARQGLSLILEASYAVISCLATYIALRVTKNPEFAIAVYAAVTVTYLVIWMLCALMVGRFSLRMGGQFVLATAAVTALVTIANSAMAWSGAAMPARVVCVVLLALILSGAGLRVAAGRMHAMEQLAR